MTTRKPARKRKAQNRRKGRFHSLRNPRVWGLAILFYIAGYATHWQIVHNSTIAGNPLRPTGLMKSFVRMIEQPLIPSHQERQPAENKAIEDARTVQQNVFTGLMSEDAGKFTLQVASSFSWREADQMMVVLAERYELNRPFFVYRSTAQSEPLFPLLYGVFDSAYQAEQEILTLPPALRDKAPFVRQFGTIQRQLKAKRPSG
ncbi:MAG: hypothetical protein AAF456_23045 [Planctomycetota bacterium]